MDFGLALACVDPTSHETELDHQSCHDSCETSSIHACNLCGDDSSDPRDAPCCGATVCAKCVVTSAAAGPSGELRCPACNSDGDYYVSYAASYGAQRPLRPRPAAPPARSGRRAGGASIRIPPQEGEKKLDDVRHRCVAGARTHAPARGRGTDLERRPAGNRADDRGGNASRGPVRAAARGAAAGLSPRSGDRGGAASRGLVRAAACDAAAGPDGARGPDSGAAARRPGVGGARHSPRPSHPRSNPPDPQHSPQRPQIRDSATSSTKVVTTTKLNLQRHRGRSTVKTLDPRA